MKPTDEQQRIINAFNSTRDNLLVTARAGAAKTTTLQMLINEWSKPCLYLAFNRSVVLEAKEKVPASCTVMTLNGIGHHTLARGLPGRIQLEKQKLYQLVREEGYKGKKFGEILRALRLSKQHGFVPSHKATLCNADTFFSAIDLRFNEAERELICTVADKSFDLVTSQGIIDFNDQILVPTLLKMPFKQFPIVFVDEAQDLSSINHLMVKQIVGFGTRLIAVGDDAQAIYGFRGADCRSMRRLQQDFKMEEMKLTMNFRCSMSVTLHANWRTQDMRHTPDAIEGAVAHADSFAFEDISPRTAVLCRNNAPLIDLALRMIRAGYTPNLLSRDILTEIVTALTKITKSNMSIEQAMACVEAWAEEKRRAWKSERAVNDRVECMKLFLEGQRTAGEAISRIKAMMNVRGNTVLSTVHKSKGAEYDHVIIIDRHLIKTGHDVQEDNLLYVAQTRARETLTYCSSALVSATVETKLRENRC